MADNEAVKSKEVTYGEYKGNPTITLPLGPQGFTFGLNKARAILAFIEEIKAFVKQHEKS